MKNEIIKLAQEKCKEYLKEKSITYHPSYVWLCQYIAEQVYEQILKDAVEGRVFMSFAPGHNQMVMADVDLPTNTKVRIVVLKEEEE